VSAQADALPGSCAFCDAMPEATRANLMMWVP
jgi:hypothetical protein